jgi:hypothetical protein
MLIMNCIRAREVNTDTGPAHGISATPIGIGERHVADSSFSTAPAGIRFRSSAAGIAFAAGPPTAAAQLRFISRVA